MDSPPTSGVGHGRAVAGPAEHRSPRGSSTRAGAVRLRGCLVAAGCWGALALVAMLQPNASGLGTHQELGMPECAFLARTGLPCPTCGLTTSLAALAHGRFALAWEAHPFGAVLFALLGVLAVGATAEAVSGRDVLSRLHPGRLAWAVLLGIPAGWAVKLIAGLTSGQLPLR